MASPERRLRGKMTDSSTGNLPPPRGDGGDETVFELGGLLTPLLEADYCEDVREILVIFLEEYLSNVVAVQAAVEKDDMEACADAAHSLIGSAGGIGAMELADLLMRLEKACRGGDLAGAEIVRTLLKEEQARVLPAIRRFLVQGAVEPPAI